MSGPDYPFSLSPPSRLYISFPANILCLCAQQKNLSQKERKPFSRRLNKISTYYIINFKAPLLPQLFVVFWWQKCGRRQKIFLSSITCSCIFSDDHIKNTMVFSAVWPQKFSLRNTANWIVLSKYVRQREGRKEGSYCFVSCPEHWNKSRWTA